jgi:hypothetical protein
MLRVLLIKFVSLLPPIFFRKATSSSDLAPSRYTFALVFRGLSPKDIPRKLIWNSHFLYYYAWIQVNLIRLRILFSWVVKNSFLWLFVWFLKKPPSSWQLKVLKLFFNFVCVAIPFLSPSVFYVHYTIFIAFHTMLSSYVILRAE